MELSEKEQRCFDFLESRVDFKLSLDNIHFKSWKSFVGVGSIDIYHRIAQGLGQTELKYLGGSSLYYKSSRF